MSGSKSLRRFLDADAADVGCRETFGLLTARVDRLLDFADAEIAYPGVAAHLRGCGPCSEDFLGLLATARLDG